MEKNIFISGALILLLGAALFVIGHSIPSALFLVVGVLDLVAVIFWPNITGTVSNRNEYKLGDQIADTVLLVSGVVLSLTTGMYVFFGLTVGGVASISVRYQNVSEST